MAQGLFFTMRPGDGHAAGQHRISSGFGVCQDSMRPVADRAAFSSPRPRARLRPSVLDPAGEAARGAAERLGVEGLSKLRIGKAVEMELEAPDEAEARRRLELLSDRLLANPVIEDWSLELEQS